MLNRKKILIYLGAGLVFLLLLFVIVKGLTTNSNKPSGNVSQSQDFVLSPSEKSAVEQFVKSFATLYNTYSSADLTNLTAIGDYETSSEQQATVAQIEQIQADTSHQFEQTAEVKPETFKYTYAEAGHISASITVVIHKQQNSQGQSGPGGIDPSPEDITIKEQLRLIKINNRWLVDSVTNNPNH